MAPMYLDLPPCDNLPDGAMATFSQTGPARTVRWVRLWREPDWRWCAITGWSEEGPTAAWISPIEESGDGPAELLHGGPQGLRLAEAQPGTSVVWDVTDARQWSEPFVIVRPGTQTAA